MSDYNDYYFGPAGRAWKLENVIRDGPPDWSASLSAWLLFCPGQSPAWSHYLVSAIHLRDVPNVPPVYKRFPAATHEISIVALNPALGKDLSQENYIDRITNLQESSYLTPINLVYQFEAEEDKQAETLCWLLMRAIIDGVLPAEPPLSGGDYWRESLDKTLTHIRFGSHDLPPKYLDPESYGLGKT